MKVEITDVDAFSSLKPDALSRYLVVNGWREVRHVEGELTVYSKRDRYERQQLVWMPITDQYSDYASMVARLVKTVAETEDKSELQLLDDLETVAIGDVIRVKTYDPLNIHAHVIPFGEGITLMERARRMAVAAASSAVSQRPVHPRRPPQRASQFMKDLLLGQTERGSYQLKLIAPILQELELQQPQLPGIPERTSFSRQAVIELVRGLSALQVAATENRDRGRFIFDAFVSAVPVGVSANLCEAVTVGDEGETYVEPLEVTVTWSYALSDNTLPTSAIRFDPSLAPFIARAAKEFRARNPERITVRGWVNILERGALSGPGLIRVFASIDGKTRAVRMQPDTEAYNAAIEAHRRGSLVSVAGDLIVERGIYFRLANPSEFRILDEDAETDGVS